MELGSLLPVTSAILLSAEVLVLGGLTSLVKKTRGAAGHDLASILTRTMTFVIAAQGVQVLRDYSLRGIPQSDAVVAIEAVSLLSHAIVLTGLGLAARDVSRL